MKLRVAKNKLLELLFFTSTIVEKKNTHPIIANVLISASSGYFYVTVTNTEVNFSGKCEAEVFNEGDLTIDAKVFYDIIKELSNEFVDLEIVEGNRLEISSGNSNFKVNGISAEEFPNITFPEILESFSIDPKTLKDSLDKTIFAVSTEESRQNIAGIFFESEKIAETTKLNFVSTDGFRVSFVSNETPQDIPSFAIIIPKRGVYELKKIVEKATENIFLAVDGGFLFARSSGNILGIRLVDGIYPKYQTLFPKGKGTRVKILKSEFLSCLKRVSLVATDKNKSVSIELKDQNICCSSTSLTYGEAREFLPVVEVDGTDFSSLFNSRFLMDFIASVEDSDEINLEFFGARMPTLFSSSNNSDYVHILMSLRQVGTED